jgi:hypothetical protein
MVMNHGFPETFPPFAELALEKSFDYVLSPAHLTERSVDSFLAIKR